MFKHDVIDRIKKALVHTDEIKHPLVAYHDDKEVMMENVIIDSKNKAMAAEEVLEKLLADLIANKVEG